MALALIAGTFVLRHGGWPSLLVLTPLLISTGAWTLIGFDALPADIVQIPIPAGLPAAGVRASLGSVYWPDVSLDWPTWYPRPGAKHLETAVRAWLRHGVHGAGTRDRPIGARVGRHAQSWLC